MQLARQAYDYSLSVPPFRNFHTILVLLAAAFEFYQPPFPKITS
jgi:hypothetical protein